MDIKTVVDEEMGKLIDSGKLREMVAKSLEKSVASSIDEAIRQYSEFHKGMTGKIKEAVGVEFANVNLQTAILGLGQLVQAHVSRYVTEQTHPKLIEQLDELFKPAPKMIGLQEIIDAYKEDEADDAMSDGVDRCGLVITQDDRSWLRIGLNPKPTKRDMDKGTYSYRDKDINDVRDCEIQINAVRRDDGDGYAFKWISFGGGMDKKTTATFLPTALYGLSRRLFQMYAAGTILTISGTDADEYDTSYPTDDY